MLNLLISPLNLRFQQNTDISKINCQTLKLFLLSFKTLEVNLMEKINPSLIIIYHLVAKRDIFPDLSITRLMLVGALFGRKS